MTEKSDSDKLKGVKEKKKIKTEKEAAGQNEQGGKQEARSQIHSSLGCCLTKTVTEICICILTDL